MTGGAGQPLAGAVLAVLLALGPAAGGQELAVEDADGAVVARLPLGADGRWCLHWRHSVTGGPVADCFRNTPGGMVLERSFLHDFAAGLGHTPGRGVQRPAAGGGYWIEGIDSAVPGGALALRVGRPAVGHRIAAADAVLDLTAIAAGRRVIVRAAND